MIKRLLVWSAFVVCMFGATGKAAAIGSYGVFAYKLTDTGARNWVIDPTGPAHGAVVFNDFHGTIDMEWGSNTAYMFWVGTSWLGSEGLINEVITGTFDDKSIFVSGILPQANSSNTFDETVQGYDATNIAGVAGGGFVDPSQSNNYQFNGIVGFNMGIPIFVRPEIGEYYTNDFSITPWYIGSWGGVYETLNFHVTNAPPAPVPEPSTFLLFSVGFGGFGLYRRKITSVRAKWLTFLASKR